jgi:prepilin-type N-terminal cleavage/methylation domain-containing protein/prepilin-type processing-associated H-X9-DG protein
MHPSPHSRIVGVSRRAFTLIELLTVIAIIGILAAIIIPTVGAVRATAQASRCASNLRQLSTAFIVYTNDNKGYFPPGDGWDRAINPYVGNTAFDVYNPFFTCAADARDQSIRPRSYMVSAMSAGTAGLGVFSRNSTGPSRPYSSLTAPPRTIVITELFTGGAVANVQFESPFSWVDGWLGGTGPLLDGKPYHSTGQNYGFADGHVERLKVSEVTTGGIGGTATRWRAFYP